MQVSFYGRLQSFSIILYLDNLIKRRFLTKVPLSIHLEKFAEPILLRLGPLLFFESNFRKVFLPFCISQDCYSFLLQKHVSFEVSSWFLALFHQVRVNSFLGPRICPSTPANQGWEEGQNVGNSFKVFLANITSIAVRLNSASGLQHSVTEREKQAQVEHITCNN